MVVVETGQHPQLVPSSVVAEADLTPVKRRRGEQRAAMAAVACCVSDRMFYSLCASGTGGAVEGFGRKPLHFSSTQLPGDDSTLVLLELQQGLEDGPARVAAGLFLSICL